MFDTIVLGHDGSEDAQRAVPLAAELARRYDAVLVLVHVDERVVGKGGPTSVRPDEGEIQAEVTRVAEELEGQGLTVKVELAATVLGGPAQVIEHIADGMKADLIVVGTRGRSPVAGLLLGSIPQRLLHISPRPVLVVPGPRDS